MGLMDVISKGRDSLTGKKNKAIEQNYKYAFSITLDDLEDYGYTRIIDSPEFQAGISVVADLISNMTIHLMKNGEDGDERIVNELSRKVDINPNNYLTRKGFVYNLVVSLLTEGNAVIVPFYRETLLDNLVLIPSYDVQYKVEIDSYKILINNVEFDANDLLHFTINNKPNDPYIGTSYNIALKSVLDNLKQAATTKKGFMASQYMPSVIISVETSADEMASEEGRNKLLEKYIENKEAGKPWVIPTDLMNVQSVKPLTLKDLAINENVEIDKKTVAAVMGIPSFLLGVGEFNQEEYNNFINTKIMSIAKIIEQEYTKKLIYSDKWFFRFNIRSLLSYSIRDTVDAGSALVDRSAMSRNEFRDWLGLNPEERYEELLTLENYIPTHMLGTQKKLNGGNENVE